MDIRSVFVIETGLACGLGLVTVGTSSSIIPFVHFTARKHLSDNSNLFPLLHPMIAEVCLTYFNFQHARSFSLVLRLVSLIVSFAE